MKKTERIIVALVTLVILTTANPMGTLSYCLVCATFSRNLQDVNAYAKVRHAHGLGSVTGINLGKTLEW